MFKTLESRAWLCWARARKRFFRFAKRKLHRIEIDFSVFAKIRISYFLLVFHPLESWNWPKYRRMIQVGKTSRCQQRPANNSFIYMFLLLLLFIRASLISFANQEPFCGVKEWKEWKNFALGTGKQDFVRSTRVIVECWQKNSLGQLRNVNESSSLKPFSWWWESVFALREIS